MNMNVQIGISCPSNFEGKLTKGMFKRKDVQIEFANWDTVSYDCPTCNYHSGHLGNYVTKLEDHIKELESRITVQNWYVEDKKKHGLL